MTDYKRLSENTFNIQAKTYDTDKNGKHARNLYQYVIDSLSTLKFLEILDVGCGTGEILCSIRKLYPTASLHGIDKATLLIVNCVLKEIHSLI